MIRKTFFLFALLAISSCNDDADTGITDNLKGVDRLKINLSSRLSVDKTTKNVSPLFQKLGVDGIEVANSELSKNNKRTDRTFKVSTKSNIAFEGETIPWNEYIFTIEDDFLVNLDFPDQGVSIIDDKAVIKNGDEISYLEENTEVWDDRNLQVLLIMMSEIITPVEEKAPNTAIASSGRDCGFWTTYYDMYSGMTRSAMTRELDNGLMLVDSLIELSGSSCYYQGTDVYCEFGDFVCVGVVTYCCPNSDPPY